jgi:hypothetical protein
MAEKKPMSQARRDANKKWNDANLKERYDRVQLVLPKGEKEVIKAAADKSGCSLNAYVVESIRQRMEREGMILVAEDSTGGHGCGF